MRGAERPTTTWSFRLLAVFLLLLYANLPLVVPRLAAFAPAQTIALGALALLVVEVKWPPAARWCSRGPRAT